MKSMKDPVWGSAQTPALLQQGQAQTEPQKSVQPRRLKQETNPDPASSCAAEKTKVPMAFPDTVI